MKPNNVIYLKCTEDSFYRMWIEFLAPFHKLTARERDVAARIILHYFRFSENVDDPEVVRDLLWSKRSKKDMMDALGMSSAHLQIILAKLRATGFIIDDNINPKYIPHKGEEPRFMLSVVYDWSSKQSPVQA